MDAAGGRAGGPAVSVLDVVVPAVDASNAAADAKSQMPLLLGLGTAVPAIRWSQAESADRLARMWNLRASALDRWRRIIAGTGIDARFSVLPVEDVIGLSTRQRMEAYERFAPDLAAAAARQALRTSGATAADVTDLIVVSCTGFSAPGVDIELMEMLGLDRSVRRTLISFMGCFGAINGLRAAIGACCADRAATALVVCVELCSLHLRSDADPQNLVASSLFADGAAAAIVGGVDSAAVDRAENAVGRLTLGRGLVLPRGRDWMTWRITDSGFAMTLKREVPAALQAELAAFVEAARNDGEPAPKSFIVHPGGPGILDAVDAALHLDGQRGLTAAQTVLKQFGNMSSGTVLFVLDEALRTASDLPAMLLAFGPGLTIESLLVVP